MVGVQELDVVTQELTFLKWVVEVAVQTEAAETQEETTQIESTETHELVAQVKTADPQKLVIYKEVNVILEPKS